MKSRTISLALRPLYLLFFLYLVRMVVAKFLWVVLTCCIRSIGAAPSPEKLVEFVINTNINSSTPFTTVLNDTSRELPNKIHANDVESFLIAPWTQAPESAPSNSIGDYHQYPFSFSYIPPTSALPTPQQTTTVTKIEEEPMTVTVTLPPSTVTQIVTVIETSSVSLQSPSTEPDPKMGPGSPKAIWTSPEDMSDLSSFQISKFGTGEKNMKIVKGLPSSAKGPDSRSARGKSLSSSLDQGNDNRALIQILYPENSIDPANKPQGGAEFYAEPIDISNARNVTMGYSVFFPRNFDWVLAGKLPGLYGGRPGCSGGDAALDCFSTRLMWREDGAGELYLYAPKNKQTNALCSDPNSVCDADYGLSIGRGLFHWQPGSWTRVEQTVCLNTPGKQDGHFTLMVNGKRAIFRNDVFYREDMSKKSLGKTTQTSQMKTTSTMGHVDPTTTSTDDGDGDVLGPILGGILGIRGEKNSVLSASLPGPTDMYIKHWRGHVHTKAVPLPRSTAKPPIETTAAVVETSVAATESEVKFVGIFFSTFFGGHESKYATPKDQYTWFKDFSLSYNA